jgi:hypothetical protein
MEPVPLQVLGRCSSTDLVLPSLSVIWTSFSFFRVCGHRGGVRVRWDHTASACVSFASCGS